MRKTALMMIFYALILGIVLLGGFLFVNRPQLMVVDAPLPESFPQSGFAHTEFEALLHEYVDSSGNVNYRQWHANTSDRMRLERYLSAVSRFSPDNSPERFDGRSDALAYWLYPGVRYQ